MIIEETKGNTEILISKSTRDKIMSAKIPVDSGINNTPSCTYIVGKPGSGKTHYVESLMKSQYRNCKSGITTCFDSVFVVSPASSQDSYSNSFVKDCDPEKVYDTLNYNNLADIYEGIKETHDLSDKDNNYFSLLILDDVATELRDKQVSKLLLRLLRNHRHLSLTILIISQNYMALEKNSRDNIQCLVQFATNNIKEKERIRIEYLGHLKPKEFEVLWEYMFKEKYQFLMVDRKHETIHKTFNKLDITGIEKTL
tara:strand:+ start:16245 stop:17009 length:765 start_codon:yes stop_codon:yes gene_type:complete